MAPTTSSSSLFPAALAGLIAAGLALGADSRPTAPPQAGRHVYHVAPSGSDRNPGTTTEPLGSIQSAVDKAQPGDTIAVHAGTYSGRVEIRRSGAPGRPIVLTSAGDGEVTITAQLPPEDCSRKQPSRTRAITVDDGSDDWILQGLTIQGGILISGKGGGPEVHAQRANRSLPGRGDTPDPEAARHTLESLGVNSSDSVQVLHNVIRGRGIYVFLGRFGRIEGNDIGQIDCGTGPGILVSRISDFWTIRSNHVHDLAAAEGNHFMNEGIRHSNGSMYNLTEENVVEDVEGRGRGITTDAGASFNTIRQNTVRRAEQGFSEQAGGRGNKWLSNLAEANRRFGFNIYAKREGDFDQDSGKHLEANTALPAFLEYRCNRSVSNPVGLGIGDVRKSTFEQNQFGVVTLSPRARQHWSGYGNLWEGRSEAPTGASISGSTAGCSSAGAGEGPG